MQTSHAWQATTTKKATQRGVGKCRCRKCMETFFAAPSLRRRMLLASLGFFAAGVATRFARTVAIGAGLESGRREEVVDISDFSVRVTSLIDASASSCRSPLTVIIGLVLLFASCVISVPAGAGDVSCAVCGAEAFSCLDMYCPDCGALIGARVQGKSTRPHGSLLVEILYTGADPHNMPEYGKLSINGRYVGNIPLVERESRQDAQGDIWKQGLGHEYTALFRQELREVEPGVMTVRLDMKFKRGHGGLLRSCKTAVYPHRSIKTGERTVVRHVFEHPRTFAKTTQPKKSSDMEKTSGRPVSEANVQTLHDHGLPANIGSGLRVEITTEPTPMGVEQPSLQRKPGAVALESVLFP